MSFSEPLLLSGSTGALSTSIGVLTGSTGELPAISTGGPVSSFIGENTGFSLKFEPEEVGSVQNHLGYSYIQEVMQF